MRSRLAIVMVALCTAAVSMVFGQSATPAPPQRSTATPARPAAPKAMVNDDVIRMVKNGLADDLIVGAIRRTPKTNFDLGADGLIALKAAGVTDAVVRVMLDPRADKDPVTAATSSPTPSSAPPPSPKVSSPAPSSPTPSIQSGAEVQLRLLKEVTSETAHVGDRVELEVVNDLTVEGRVLIAKGAIALGNIDDVTAQRFVARPGKLGVSLKSVKAVNGLDVPLRGGQIVNGGRAAGFKGQEATIPAGTLFAATVSGDALPNSPSGPLPIAASSTSREPAPQTPASRPTVTPTVLQSHESGIYATVSNRLEELEPTIATSGGMGAGSAVTSGLTFGIKKAKVKASIRGRQAMMRVVSNAEFYFYGESFNPNEYMLVKLETTDSNREIVVGEGGMISARTGIRDEDQMQVTRSKIAQGAYKVVPSHPLTPGEYGFIRGIDPQQARLFDFGVDR